MLSTEQMRNFLRVDHWPRKPRGDLRTNGRAMGTGGGVVGNVPTFRPGENGWRSDLVGEILGRLRCEDEEGRKSSIKKPGDGFKLIFVFPCVFLRNFLVLAIYSEHALPASFSWGIYPIDTYINTHFFKGVYIGLISKGVPIKRAFPPFCLWIHGFPMLPGY